MDYIAKIIYQGICGSFSEVAAEKLARQENIFKYDLVPAISSENVCYCVDNGNADYGVVAIKNSTVGIVNETKKAIEKRNLSIISVVSFPIVHCLFKFSEIISIDNIKYVASHEQAIGQCRNTIKSIAPKAKEIVVEDTALAAKKLNEGSLSSDTAVICSKKAGEIYNLCLIREMIQDCDTNTTYFALLSRNVSSV